MNMTVNTQIMRYLSSKYDKEKIILILHENNLFGQLGDLFITFNDNDLKKLKKEKIGVKYLEIVLRKLCILMDKNKIRYCTFKGVVLANRLYGDNNCRQLNDLDIFVYQQDFDKALKLFKKEGAVLVSESELKNPHHAVLVIQHVFIEIHRNVLSPLIGINEDYLHNNIDYFRLLNYNFKTFSITATLLHLLYHLYMDTCLPSNNIYAISAKTSIGIANRFLYRAYEIALFAEKFSKGIRWDDIISDIKTQKLRIIFKYMIDDILEIFPNAFPQELKKAIYNKSYIENEEQMLFYKFLEGHKNHKQEKNYLLCEFIKKFWQRKNNNALIIPDGSAIVLEDKDFNEFKCICNISRNDKKIHLEFTIEDDDIFFSDLGNYDTQKSDGIHLILCSTTEYSYNSIFFFPKNTKENNKVIPYDFLEGKVVENDIIASYEMIKNGYKINVTLTEEFITKNHLESFFYLGLVVSSCSSKTKHREKQLVLSSPADQWYNPLHFAKINI